MRKLINNFLDIMGIMHRERAFKGPDCVQIDLSNNCNNNCVACWCNSPLLGEQAISPEQKSKMLDYAVAIRTIDRLRSMGTRGLFFSGGGEPLTHPRCLDIISYAKKKGFICYLNTNFTLIDEVSLERIIKMRLDYLVASVWAATPETYCRTHPNKKEEDFLRIRDLLVHLNYVRGKPEVRIYNVINNLNFHEFNKMIEFCLETGSDWVEFTLVDTIPGRTEGLLLDDKQSAELSVACEAAEREKRYYRADGKFLVSNFTHFKRRLQSRYSAQAEYDRGFLEGIPCYIGWLFARILADGNVNSCLKSHRFPVGNIYEESFDKIWNGKKQREFRRRTLGRDMDFFSVIGNDLDKKVGCYKSCDDLGRNLAMHEKIKKLKKWGRFLFQNCPRTS